MSRWLAIGHVKNAAGNEADAIPEVRPGIGIGAQRREVDATLDTPAHILRRRVATEQQHESPAPQATHACITSGQLDEHLPDGLTGVRQC